MKKIVAICLLSAITLTTQAQQAASANCNCPTPKGGKFVYMCTLVENQDFNYKKLLMEMSCVDSLDSPETKKEKIKCMWEKYYAEFGCDNSGFLVPQGNILKYAVNQEFELFVDGMVKLGIDINMKDPVDGKTLLDFTLDEISRYKGYANDNDKVKELEKIYKHLKNDLKAKHASEL